jgi:hypothetical protein
MEPQTAQMIVIGAGGAGAAKPTAELVKEFYPPEFGPPADEIGKLLASRFATLNERRTARAAALIAHAAVLVARSDAEPQPVRADAGPKMLTRISKRTGRCWPA